MLPNTKHLSSSTSWASGFLRRSTISTMSQSFVGRPWIRQTEPTALNGPKRQTRTSELPRVKSRELFRRPTEPVKGGRLHFVDSGLKGAGLVSSPQYGWRLAALPEPYREPLPLFLPIRRQWDRCSPRGLPWAFLMRRFKRNRKVRARG